MSLLECLTDIPLHGTSRDLRNQSPFVGPVPLTSSAWRSSALFILPTHLSYQWPRALDTNQPFAMLFILVVNPPVTPSHTPHCQFT